MPSRPRLSALLVLCALGLGSAATAQPVPAGGATVYRHAQPGQPVIAVNVWGAVRQPGWYEVSPATGLYQILSLAGGPVVGEVDSREDRRVHLTLLRGASEPRAVVFAATLDELTAAQAWAAPLPPLQAGDVLTVQSSVRPRFTWRDGLSVLSAVGGAIVALSRIL